MTSELLPSTERVDRLRAAALARVADPKRPWHEEPELNAARSWTASSGETSHMIRRGRLAADVLSNLTPVIDSDELLVGKFSCRSLETAEVEELDRWRASGARAITNAPGQRAHMAIDYERLLRLGVSGVLRLIDGYVRRLDPTQPQDLTKAEFYEACRHALTGVLSLSTRYADHAEALAADETDELRASELREIASVCRRVPFEPARTFREAVQAVHFVTFCQCAGNRFLLMQLGRPDRYLLPYYRRDLADGTITQDAALELIDCLGILLNEYTPRGLAVGWMVGGRDETGVDISNELTYLMVQSIGHVRMAYPGIGVCWTSDTPSDLMDISCRLLASGCTHPALFGDDVITSGLLGLGLPHRDACQYVHSTCVEITPIAVSNVYVASPYYNLVQALHDVLHIPPRDGQPTIVDEVSAAPATFDELYSRWKLRMRDLIRDGVAEQNRSMAQRAVSGGFPLLSCFVNDCLAAGRDIDNGGARANWIESSFVGLANLVDALAAIRKLVFEDGRVSLDRLRDALAADFDGHADILSAVSAVPRYGTDCDWVDALAVDVTSFLAAECERYRTYWGGPVVPGFFCWIMHEYLGRRTAASADGRRAGFPFADGAGPAQGRERQGPTAMVRSVTKWNHAPMLGGIAVNMRFQPERDTERLVSPIRRVIETFLRLGGFEAQVNVVDGATLRAAQESPEQYRDLVVRVAGYSDYFVGLSCEMQSEVISRAEMSLL